MTSSSTALEQKKYKIAAVNTRMKWHDIFKITPAINTPTEKKREKYVPLLKFPTTQPSHCFPFNRRAWTSDNARLPLIKATTPSETMTGRVWKRFQER